MIYFDNSATTKADPEVVSTYDKVSDKVWGNPSSLHQFGEEAFNLLEQSRKQIADLIGASQSEVLFTSGGSEGDNWVLKGTAIEKRQFGNHLITTAVEHPAIHNSMEQLKKLGFEVKEFPFSDTNDVGTVVAQATSEVDALFIPTDNTAASSADIIHSFASKTNTPIIAGEEGIASKCGIATLSIDYYQLGRLTGEMAVKILKGEADISTMEIEYFPNPVKKFNKEICQALSITVPEGYVAIGE